MSQRCRAGCGTQFVAGMGKKQNSSTLLVDLFIYMAYQAAVMVHYLVLFSQRIEAYKLEVDDTNIYIVR